MATLLFTIGMLLTLGFPIHLVAGLINPKLAFLNQRKTSKRYEAALLSFGMLLVGTVSGMVAVAVNPNVFEQDITNKNVNESSTVTEASTSTFEEEKLKSTSKQVEKEVKQPSIKKEEPPSIIQDHSTVSNKSETYKANVEVHYGGQLDAGEKFNTKVYRKKDVLYIDGQWIPYGTFDFNMTVDLVTKQTIAEVSGTPQMNYLHCNPVKKSSFDSICNKLVTKDLNDGNTEIKIYTDTILDSAPDYHGYKIDSQWRFNAYKIIVPSKLLTM